MLSLRHKLYLVELELCNYDIICLTEIWLNDTAPDDDICMPGYHTPLIRDILQQAGKGVAVYIKQHMRVNRRHDLEFPNIESLWVEICTICPLLLVLNTGKTNITR